MFFFLKCASSALGWAVRSFSKTRFGHFLSYTSGIINIFIAVVLQCSCASLFSVIRNFRERRLLFCLGRAAHCGHVTLSKVNSQLCEGHFYCSSPIFRVEVIPGIICNCWRHCFFLGNSTSLAPTQLRHHSLQLLPTVTLLHKRNSRSLWWCCRPRQRVSEARETRHQLCTAPP